MTIAAIESGIVTEGNAQTFYEARLGELREVMVPVLIYTDDSIAAEREYHLRQPWTD